MAIDDIRRGRRSAIISQRQKVAGGKKSLNAAYGLQDANVLSGECKAGGVRRYNKKTALMNERAVPFAPAQASPDRDAQFFLKFTCTCPKNVVPLQPQRDNLGVPDVPLQPQRSTHK